MSAEFSPVRMILRARSRILLGGFLWLATGSLHSHVHVWGR